MKSFACGGYISCKPVISSFRKRMLCPGTASKVDVLQSQCFPSPIMTKQHRALLIKHRPPCVMWPLSGAHPIAWVIRNTMTSPVWVPSNVKTDDRFNDQFP